MTCTACDPCPLQSVGPGLHYEIHVTVEACNTERFSAICEELDVKPLLIELQTKRAGVQRQLMTSKTLKNVDDPTARHFARDLEIELRRRNLTVARTKIETVPWHPDAATPMLGQYHETHIKVKVDDVRADYLRSVVEELDAHLSRSSFTEGHRFVTIRRTLAHIGETHFITWKLIDLEYEIYPPITEFVLYDSNQRMDDDWLTT
jgi:hypothetical protein